MSSTPVRTDRGRPAVAALTVLAVLLALVGVPRTAPAKADPPATGCDRDAVVMAWRTGGSQVRVAAEQALLGGDADICAFLDSGWSQRGRVDDRLGVNQMMAVGGPAVRGAAQRALDATDPAALGAFLESGWQQPWWTDQRVRVDQMMASGGAQLRAAAQRALDATDPAALGTFLDSGWRQPHLTDQRLRVNQILSTGGPQVRIGAQRALDAGTVEALTRFIDVDWAVAAARDQETQTLTDLVRAAEVAGARAEAETRAARAEADRAVAEAAAARQAARAAAEATARAQDDAVEAAAASRRAADAADRAAHAAQQAVGAARAASAAARVAAGAAARAATAASRAGQAASRAYHSAALAATDASKASQARAIAGYARDIAVGAQRAAEAAAAAGVAARHAGEAASAAASAGQHAADSAEAAIEAGNFAASAGADASVARAAAARARANADRATRAAQAAVAFAGTAANAAFAARDAANRAAANANAAAAAAEDAADHAGNAAEAAVRATNHANAAVRAAEAAVDAATQANVVYEAARAADAERLRISTEQGREAALAAAAEVNRLEVRAGWDAAQAARRSAEVDRLIAEATDPATPEAVAVRGARQVALALAGADGAWTRAAALDALAGADAIALEFVHAGVVAAAGQDDRATLSGLMATGSPAMRAGAQAALDGSDADVAEFLRTRDYPGRAAEDRLAVNQVQAAARDAGDVVTVEHAQRALDAGTGEALRQFLEVGRFTAAAADQRVEVNQILAAAGGGPELKAAAQIALDGPPAFLAHFLDVERHAAAQRDQDAAAHDEVVSALLAQAAEVAAVAVQSALEAQATAATARNEAGRAADYARQAAESAARAADHARRAQQSAARAQEAANRAAASARTAVAAANSANASARRAARSAAWAHASAEHAASYASEAFTSATNAYHAAIAAQKDAEQARAAYAEAFHAAKQAAADEVAAWAYQQGLRCEAVNIDKETCLSNVEKIVKDPAKVAYLNAGVCELLYQEGSQAYDACLRDVLNPQFELNQELTLVTAVLTMATALFTALAAAEIAVLAGVAVAVGIAYCVGVCAALLQAFTPILAPELVGLPTAGVGVVAGTAVSVRTAAMLERAAVEAQAQNGAFARLVSAIKLCGRNSFTAGTPVLLADGTSRPIEQVRVGDRVLATDPATGTTSAEPVTDILTGAGVKRLVEVTVDPDGRGGVAPTTLRATAEHPFWVADLRQWVEAGELRVGQWLRTGAGSWVQITRTGHRTEPATVHNLTVAVHHTYYVGRGAGAVLVHNSCRDYVWAPVPAPVDVLPAQYRWHPSQGIPVIGRWPENAVVREWPGHAFFDIPRPMWNAQFNDAWIQSIVNQRGTVYVGSLTKGNYWHKGRHEPSTFAREIQQLLDNGYRWQGDHLVPPPR
ncbi:polymorphic toxin-type HINT domain-containing protein [Plantactinospora sp. WMMB334]|uniref:polymorphic toxin-type HINT domain-containing protein n=1 Tax=Plantactinospora sp. WMMB334 TaxID=3404119 RepID=UPI003B92AEC0